MFGTGFKPVIQDRSWPNMDGHSRLKLHKYI